MSTKKGKAKVSQVDLRKMMQQLKHKKSGDVGGAATHKPPAHNLNNGNNVFKRKAVGTEEYLKHNVEKKVKIDSVVKTTLPPTEMIPNTKQIKPHLQKSVKDSNGQSHNASCKNNEQKSLVSAPQKKFQKVKPTPPKSGKAVVPLVSGIYSDSSSSSDEADVSSVMPQPSKAINMLKGKSTANKQSGVETSLPAGFFDDPETDAKIRGVETPADKMDREWENFQKELQHETMQSEQLIEEEQDTGHFDREIDEIDEQIQCYNRVEKLSDKKEISKKAKQKFIKIEKVDVKLEVDSNSSGSSNEDDELEWREKDAFN